MNCRKLFKVLCVFFATIFIVLASYFIISIRNFYPFPSPAGSKIFYRIATVEKPERQKSLSGFYDHLGKIKLSSEIPEFKGISKEKMALWDRSVKELTQSLDKLDDMWEQMSQEITDLPTSKKRDQFYKQQNAFDEILNKDSEIQNINSQIDELHKKNHLINRSCSPYEEKLELLQYKQYNIQYGKPGSIRNYLLTRGVFPEVFLVGLIKRLYKKTRKYQEIEKQILKTEKKLKPFYNEIKVNNKKIADLMETKEERVKSLIQTSTPIKQLKDEIDSLKEKSLALIPKNLNTIYKNKAFQALLSECEEKKYRLIVLFGKILDSKGFFNGETVANELNT